jgi:ribonuclease HI
MFLRRIIIGRQEVIRSFLSVPSSSIRTISSSKNKKGKSNFIKAAQMNIVTTDTKETGIALETTADSKTVTAEVAKNFIATPKRLAVKTAQVTKSTKSRSNNKSNSTTAFQYKPRIKLKPKENLPILSLDDLQSTIFLYTDGSCFGNNNVRVNVCPAGWGVVALKLTDHGIARLTATCQEFKIPFLAMEHKQQMKLLNDYLTVSACEVVAELFGPVILPTNNSLKPFTFGADVGKYNHSFFTITYALPSFFCSVSVMVGSNNTGELSAIGEGLLLLRDHLTEKPKRCIIFFDSEYAARSVLQIYNGEKNKELIDEIRRIFDSSNEKMKEVHGPSAGISFVHVKAHSGNVWNDRVDALAKQGNSGAHCSVGRYAELIVQ